MVTDCRSATESAKETTPGAIAGTAEPTDMATSTPQCPPYRPMGAKPLTISPVGGTRPAHVVGGMSRTVRTVDTMSMG